MEYTLHKLPEGFIVTSDEEDREPNDKILLPDTPSVFDRGLKVIAQESNIIFSDLKEEEQKEIGYFDVDEWIKQTTSSLKDDIIIKTSQRCLKAGFNKTFKLLSDRNFELKIKKLKSELNHDLRESTSTINKQMIEGALWGLEKLSQSLSQQSWKVEIQHICEGIKREGESCNFNNNCKYPNCGKIKITKIL